MTRPDVMPGWLDTALSGKISVKFDSYCSTYCSGVLGHKLSATYMGVTFKEAMKVDGCCRQGWYLYGRFVGISGKGQ